MIPRLTNFQEGGPIAENTALSFLPVMLEFAVCSTLTLLLHGGENKKGGERMGENGLIWTEVLDLLKRWCEWSGADAERFVNEAILTDVKCFAENVAVLGIPKAIEFSEEAIELLKKMGALKEEEE
ncbi:hypothetical protein [Archaeoglobus sp.]